MRLKFLVLSVALFGAALSVPTPAHAGLNTMKTKMSHMFKGTHSGKRASDEAPAEKPAKTNTAVERKHTNGFPEADKRDPKYQPQSDTWLAEKPWKTNSNKDSWKGQ